jgi:hypothetical protein
VRCAGERVHASVLHAMRRRCVRHAATVPVPGMRVAFWRCTPSRRGDTMTATTAFLAQLAQGPLPTVESEPERIAMLQVLQRTGHIHARFEVREGRTRATVEALTPLGRKMASCLDNGMSRRLTTAFWAFKVRESEAPQPHA